MKRKISLRIVAFIRSYLALPLFSTKYLSLLLHPWRVSSQKRREFIESLESWEVAIAIEIFFICLFNQSISVLLLRRATLLSTNNGPGYLATRNYSKNTLHLYSLLWVWITVVNWFFALLHLKKICMPVRVNYSHSCYSFSDCYTCNI